MDAPLWFRLVSSLLILVWSDPIMSSSSGETVGILPVRCYGFIYERRCLFLCVSTPQFLLIRFIPAIINPRPTTRPTPRLILVHWRIQAAQGDQLPVFVAQQGDADVAGVGHHCVCLTRELGGIERSQPQPDVRPAAQEGAAVPLAAQLLCDGLLYLLHVALVFDVAF